MANQKNKHNYTTEYIKAVKKLTPRQVEVLDGVTAGYTSREIAQKLFISHRTVDKYREQLRNKLDLSGYRQLFRWCQIHMNGRKL